jgi:hypothetical protein
VHCAAGYRASIAAGLLEAAGRHVVLIDDQFPLGGVLPLSDCARTAVRTAGGLVHRAAGPAATSVAHKFGKVGPRTRPGGRTEA